MKKFLKSVYVVWFMRLLTLVYLILIFISLATNQLLSTDDVSYSTIALNIIELHFLVFFIAEGALNIYVIGI